MQNNLVKIAKADVNILQDPLKGSWKNKDSHFTNVLNDPWYKLIFLLMGEITYAVSDYFRAHGFMPALAPITAQSVTSPMGLGSDSLPVSIELFGKQTYLMDSMQFHLEYLLRQFSDGVFYIMPTFRGEDSDARHLNEFFHIEAEFIGNLEDNIKHIESLICSCIKRVVQTNGEAVSSYTGDINHLTQLITDVEAGGLPRLKFKDAVALLGDDESYYGYHDGEIISLTSKAERKLLQEYNKPLWLTHLPSIGVPFYQADSDENGYSLCADLLMGIGETVGCGQRHKTYQQTLNALKLREVDQDAYDWYLRLKNEYPMQTSGFGIGLERLLLWILKHDDIRDTQLIVRQKGLNSIP
jgi:asparaginyl-tRNA synthetase